MEYHKQQLELHYHDSNSKEAGIPASVEVANGRQKTSTSRHLSCYYIGNSGQGLRNAKQDTEISKGN